MERIHTEAGCVGVVHFGELDFVPKRLYWLGNTPHGTVRGLHAHKSLRQFLVCVSGQLEIELDDGRTRVIHRLSDASDGLLIEPGQWRILRELDPETLVLVLASEDYDPDDYIHDYDEFLAWVHQK